MIGENSELKSGVDDTMCRRSSTKYKAGPKLYDQFPSIKKESDPSGPADPASGLTKTLRGTLREYISCEI
jgi:hypothetical protein